MLTVIYRTRNGTDNFLDFTDPRKAFDRFFSMVNDARKEPFISSDHHIGSFSYKNLEWYMTKDDEGKELAYRRFENWLSDFKK